MPQHRRSTKLLKIDLYHGMEKKRIEKRSQINNDDLQLLHGLLIIYFMFTFFGL
jgi:hypothetical protein